MSKKNRNRNRNLSSAEKEMQSVREQVTQPEPAGGAERADSRMRRNGNPPCPAPGRNSECSSIGKKLARPGAALAFWRELGRRLGCVFSPAGCGEVMDVPAGPRCRAGFSGRWLRAWAHREYPRACRCSAQRKLDRPVVRSSLPTNRWIRRVG